MRYAMLAWVLVAGVLFGGACAPAGTAPPAPPPATAPSPTGAEATRSTLPAPTAVPSAQTVKHGYNPILAGAPMFIAQERGYFAEAGFELEFTTFDTGAQMVASAAAGQLDVIAAVPSPSLFNALARGIDLKAVAVESWTGTFLVLRKELADSGQVRSLADLRGKRVSFNLEGIPVDYALRIAFEKSGLRLDEVEVHRLPNPDLPAALANAAVDAGVVPEPLPTLIESRGIGARALDVQGLAGRQTGAMLVAGPSMLARGEAVNTRFLVAYLRGLRDYLAAITDERVSDPDMVAILSKWTSIPPSTVAAAVASKVDPSGRLDIEDLNRQQDYWRQVGLVPREADLRAFIDHRYLDAALAQSR
jgi:NitT/TauT family transport system substrate-binding protein